MRRLVVAAMAVVALGVGIATNVADGRLEEDEAADTLLDIVTVNPRKAFRL